MQNSALFKFGYSRLKFSLLVLSISITMENVALIASKITDSLVLNSLVLFHSIDVFHLLRELLM